MPFRKLSAQVARLIGLFVASRVTHADHGPKKSGWRFRFGIMGRELETNDNSGADLCRTPVGDLILGEQKSLNCRSMTQFTTSG